MKDGRSRLAAEAVFLYRTDGNGFAEALLSSRSIDEFTNRLLALSRIASRDADTIRHIRSDRAAVQRLGAQLVVRERQQAALVADVSARRAKAQAALDGQQRYADSLSAQVAKELQAQQAASSGSAAAVAQPTVGSSSSAWAAVEGSGGKYAVSGSQPRAYKATGLTFDGIATWYGGRGGGNALTCAHKTLPFGTRIAVTYRGRRVIVTVNDRGPYGAGRVIDITKRAASIIGLTSAGVGHVHCEVVRAK